MSRFKFRVWDQEDKVIIDDAYGISFCRDGILHGFFYRDHVYCANCLLQKFEDLLNSIPKHFRYIPLQYTGFKDCEGKEVYEGDIIVETYKGIPDQGGIVKFKDGSWMSIYQNDEHGLYDELLLRKVEKCLRSEELRLVVAANVYENSGRMLENDL